MTAIATETDMFGPPTDEELIDFIKGIGMDGAVESHEIKPEKEDTMGQFKGWGSTPRENKKKTVLEKIDGTNACVVIYDGQVKAQSRKRMITPDDDNYGFAKWVYDNAGVLMDTLGFGYHYGEWFGEGIQKNPLGIEGKRFALFHATKYTEDNGYELNKVDGLETVPLLHHGQCNIWTIPQIVEDLEMYGSKVKGAATDGTVAAKAEGIIVWNNETKTRTKILLENDAFHKWEVGNG